MFGLVAAVAMSAAVSAQQAQQSAAAIGQPNQAAVAQCAQAQPQAIRTIDAANMRLEAARQGNSPSAMRSAVDDLQSALRQLRAQLEPCAGLQAAGDADPHAGHAMPNASSKPPSRETKPGRVTDPVNGFQVDPAGAPKATHEGQTYYFSSEASRKEFLQNPAKFIKNPER